MAECEHHWGYEESTGLKVCLYCDVEGDLADADSLITILRSELRVAEKQITQLNADLAEENEQRTMWKKAFRKTNVERNQLKADLAKFGGHTAECSYPVMETLRKLGQEKVKPMCECGWAEIEKGYQ